MAEDRIDSIIDRPKVQADVDFFAGKVKEVRTLLDILRKNNLSIFNAASLRDFTAAAKQIDITTRQLNKAVQDLSKAQERNSKTTLNEAKAEKELAAARERNAKAAKVEQQLTNTVTKEKEKINKAALKEIDNLNRLNSAYEQLKQKYKIAANSAIEFGAAQGLNSKEFKEAQVVAKKYYDQLLALEQSVGRSQRQVGDYTQATFALTQVLREAPAFANSFATGISAIGNNVPILTDQIRKLRESGLSAFQIFKVLAGSLLTFQAILPIGFLLVQSYATEIKGFFKSLFSGIPAIDQTKASQEALNNVMKKAGEDLDSAQSKVTELRTEIDLARKGFLDKKKVLEQYNESLGKTVGQAKSLNEAEQILLDKGPAIIQFYFLKAKAAAAAALADEEARKFIIAQNQTVADFIDSGEAAGATIKNIFTGIFKGTNALALETAQDLSKRGEKERQAELDRAKLFGEKYLSLQEEYIKEAAMFASANGLNFFGDSGEDNKDLEAKAEEQRKFVFEAQKALLEDRIKANEVIRDDENKDYTVRLGALRNYIAASIELINLEAEFEKGKKGATAVEVQKIEAEKQAALNQLYRDGKAERLKIVDKEYEEQAEAAKKDKAAQDKIDLDKFNTRNKRNIAFGKFIEDQLKKRQAAEKKAADEEIDIERKKQEARKRLAREAADALAALVTRSIDEEKNRVQEQIDALEARKQQEIEVATATIANAQDRAAAIATIEARANAQREAFQRRQRQLDQQKAVFERSAAVAKIIADTASAIVEALPNIPLSLLVGAIGAAQLVKVLSTPIPKYAKGTGDGKHPGGLAMVGDGGKEEMVVTPDGSVYKTPSTDTLVNLPAGSVVYPDYQKAMAEAMMMGAYRSTHSTGQINFSPVTNSIEKMGKSVVSAILQKGKGSPAPSLSNKYISQMKGLDDWHKMNGISGW